MDAFTLLIVFFVTKTLSQNCDTFREKWTNLCPSSKRRCYIDKTTNQNVEINESEFRMECNFQSPDENVIACSSLPETFTLTMSNCNFSNADFKNIIGGKEPVSLVLEYGRNQTVSNLRFDNLNKLSSITFINLSDRVFPFTFGKEIHSVRFLQIIGHAFETFGTFFNNVSSLRTLKIQRGPFEILKNETVRGLPSNLLTLDLSWNRIGVIELATFENLPKLRRLHLSGNQITELPLGIFSGLKNLELLALDVNRLTSIELGVFGNLRNMRTLNVSDNPLGHFAQEEQPFGPAACINVYASRCHFNKFPTVNWEQYLQINLDLSYNNITNLTIPACIMTEASFNLYGNNISCINLNTTFVNTQRFVRNGRNECDFDLRAFHSNTTLEEPQRFEKLFPDLKVLRCRQRNVSLRVRMPPCPTVCSCAGPTMDCSGRNLTEAPIRIPETISEVDINNNDIKALNNTEPRYWSHVSFLNISYNSLTFLEEWTLPEKLQTLDISNNRLQLVPFELIDRIRADPMFRIYVSNNKWICNCKLVAFKEWFMEHGDRIGDYDITECNFSLPNGSTKLKTIKDIYVDTMCREMQVDNVILIVLLPIVLVAILVFSYYYKFTLLALLYSVKLLPSFCYSVQEQHRKYDAFICANVNDADVVAEIVKKLEPLHSLCIPERDWPKDGKFGTSSHVAYSLKNSRGTLIIVSENSLPETWFQVKFRGAYNQRLEDDVHKMILIIVGDIKGVPTKSDIGEIMATEPSLEWGERWFWHKLRYELRRPGSN